MDEELTVNQESFPTHNISSIRLQNFMGFSDTHWIDLASITLLFGRNSTGKSAVIRAIRLLKQSLENFDEKTPLAFSNTNGIDMGRYKDVIYGHEESRVLSFWFKIFLPPEFTKDQDLGRVGELRTNNEYAELKLSYVWDRIHSRAMLTSFAIYDGEDTAEYSTILSLDRVNKNTKLSDQSTTEGREFWKIESDFVEFDLTEPRSLWKDVHPIHFGSFLVGLDTGLNIPKGSYPEIYGEEVSKGFNFIEELLEHINIQVEGFLQSLVYIGPIREEPRRFYYSPNQVSTDVGSHGQNSISAFLSRKSESDGLEYLERINKLLEKSSLRCQLKIEPISKEHSLYEVSILEVGKKSDGFESNIMDVGFGVSQILPILIEGFFNGDSRLVIIEQPELHLHPQAQAELGDLFVLMSKLGVRFFLETHSESLLLRFRRRLAETSGGNPEDDSLRLSQEAFRAYFVERGDGTSTVEALLFDEWGDYKRRPAGFGDFFGTDFRELSKMKKARLSV